MALTDIQKANIRMYLGWSGRWHQSDSRLEQAMSAIETEPEHERQLTNPDPAPVGEEIGVLTRLSDIDTKLNDAHGRLKALKVGSIDLPAHREIEMLRKEGRRYVGRMAAILGVEVRQDVYSSTKPRTFQGPFGLYGGGGNYGLHG